MPEQFDAIYRRVSTAQQSLESQTPELAAWAKANRNGKDSIQWFEDSFTGKSMNRPGFKKLEQDLLAGRVRRLVVWRLDRLGRTASGLCTLFDLCMERGVALISLRDGIDLSTPAGRMMANVLASVAQFETEVRGERVKAGLEAAKARGVKLGGSKPGNGAKLNQEQVGMARTLIAGGESVSAVSRTLGVHRCTLTRALSRREMAQ